MASEMRLDRPRVDSQCRSQHKSLVDTFYWSFYETIRPSFHNPSGCRLRSKPDGTVGTIRRAVESFDGARR
jgi:hypothetical protein